MMMLLIKTLNSTRVLSIHDVPKEDDAFRHVVGYPEWIETVLNKGIDEVLVDGFTITSTRKTTPIYN